MQEVKLSKLPAAEEPAPQKSPRLSQKAPLTALNDKRNQRKMTKLGSQKEPPQPRVIADEAAEEEPFAHRTGRSVHSMDQNQVLQALKGGANIQLQACELEQANVFARLAQGGKPRNQGG